MSFFKNIGTFQEVKLNDFAPSYPGATPLVYTYDKPMHLKFRGKDYYFHWVHKGFHLEEITTYDGKMQFPKPWEQWCNDCIFRSTRYTWSHCKLRATNGNYACDRCTKSNEGYFESE